MEEGALSGRRTTHQVSPKWTGKSLSEKSQFLIHSINRVGEAAAHSLLRIFGHCIEVEEGEGRFDRNILTPRHEPSRKGVCIEPSVITVLVRSSWNIRGLDAFERCVRWRTAGETEGFLGADWTETVSCNQSTSTGEGSNEHAYC